MQNNTKLSINTDVIKKMVKIAASEVEGVVGISNKNIDLKGAIKAKTPFAGVKVESVNGALELGVYIIVDKNVNVNEIAEKVQENVKDKVQTMTGTAVTKVNVTIADIKFPEEAEETEE
jgi:uncharacterized alkaline shock family protein YloU